MPKILTELKHLGSLAPRKDFATRKVVRTGFRTRMAGAMDGRTQVVMSGFRPAPVMTSMVALIGMCNLSAGNIKTSIQVEEKG